MARKGILGTKLGMTQVFDENNRVVPVTVVKAGPNVVTRIRTPELDGYSAVQLAYGEISPRKVNKPVTGQYSAAGVNPRRYLAEFRLDNPDAAGEYEVGTYRTPSRAPPSLSAPGDSKTRSWQSALSNNLNLPRVATTFSHQSRSALRAFFLNLP